MELKFVCTVSCGGGFKTFTLYKIQIHSDEGNWSIFRRFTDFINLNDSLSDFLYEEDCLKLSALFPTKSLGGSFGGTFKHVTDRRIGMLQEYFDKLLELCDAENTSLLQLFFDFSNKGQSGVVNQIGVSKVLREGFVMVKIIKSYVGNLWNTCYLVLLKSGSLVILQSINDNLTNSILTLSLNSDGVHFTTRAARNTIDVIVSHQKIRVLIYFSSPEDTAYWMRTVQTFISSEYQNSAISYRSHNSVPNSNGRPKSAFYLNRNAASDAVKANQIGMSYRPSSTSDAIYKSKGSGLTNDDMSDIFGI